MGTKVLSICNSWLKTRTNLLSVNDTVLPPSFALQTDKIFETDSTVTDQIKY